jgi:pyruvate/2-oxoglutarate dehydrogenase complex dihydrolipoamide acyltransferase (E2) component
MKKNRYVVESLHPFRQLVMDSMELAERKHCFHGIVQVDISRARERIRHIKESTGQSLSFTGFIAYCCARAVDEDKHLHAYFDWRGRLVMFDEVDISLPVERSQNGRPVVLQTVIRAANRKTVWEIHNEIRSLQTKDLGETQWNSWLRWYVLLPRFVRILLFRIVERAPTILKRFNGTVLVTSVGMFGSRAGWGIPLPGHTLAVTIGGIAPSPVPVEGKLEYKDHLCLTLSFDHDVIDGGPAARFVQRFADLVEQAAGMDTLPEGVSPSPTDYPRFRKEQEKG